MPRRTRARAAPTSSRILISDIRLTSEPRRIAAPTRRQSRPGPENDTFADARKHQEEKGPEHYPHRMRSHTERFGMTERTLCYVTRRLNRLRRRSELPIPDSVQRKSRLSYWRGYSTGSSRLARWGSFCLGKSSTERGTRRFAKSWRSVSVKLKSLRCRTACSTKVRLKPQFCWLQRQSLTIRPCNVAPPNDSSHYGRSRRLFPGQQCHLRTGTSV